MKHRDIAKQIIRLKDADLELRNKLIQNSQLGSGYNQEMEQLHINNAIILNKIIDEIGYPSNDKVGREASEAAWLVIQHSIGRPDFMKKCVKLLEQVVNEGNGNRINLAYLSDRIAVFECKPQLYGTQFDWDGNGEMSPQPFDNLVKVNERRMSIGLNTLGEQTQVVRDRVESENESPPNDLKKRKLEIENWKRKIGWIK